MRLVVRGITGKLHEFTCDQDTSVKDVKAHLVTLESVEEAQILLVHAGRPLSDTAIPMLDLENFNRAGEIMLDLQVKMRDPVRIFLTSPLSRNKPICEVVEVTAPVTEVLDLLEDHGLTASIERTCAVIPKRDDGSTIPMPLVTSYTVADVYRCIQSSLRSSVRHLTFIPALDGCLHIIASPSAEAPGLKEPGNAMVDGPSHLECLELTACNTDAELAQKLLNSAHEIRSANDLVLLIPPLLHEVA